MISIVIPVYKNKESFLNNLRNNTQYFNNYEVIIINDDPAESLRESIKEFKNIILLENRTNLGFSKSVNKGVNEAKNRYIMLLNSDVILTDDNFKTSLDYFKNNPYLFAVAFAEEGKNKSITGKNEIFWSKGFIFHKKSDNLNFGKTAWAEGGSSIFDKSKFLEFGGFDPIYSPFYWEDIDLSYRAWKKGYQILFDPSIKVEHHHESTIGKYYSREKINTIAYRNQFIFIWKNITDPSLLINHILLMFYNILYFFIVKRELRFIYGFISAITYINIIYVKRSGQINKYRFTDKKVLQLIKQEE